MSMSAIDWLALENAYQGLEADARRVLQDTGVQPNQMVVERFADIRYIGQGFELVVPTPLGPYQAASLEPIRSSFEEAYREIFSRTPLGATAEIVNIRVSASAVAGRNDLQVTRPHKHIRHAEPKEKRQVYFGMTQSYITTPVYDRRLIPVGHSLIGPAVIEEPESTLIVPPDATAVVEEEGNIVVSLSAAHTQHPPMHAETQGRAP
jgi:N-methylhydantoinase A